MNRSKTTIARPFLTTLTGLIVFSLTVSPVMAGEYQALEGLKTVKTVFDVSQGKPQVANIVFWAVKNVYEDASVRALPSPPKVAVVFHGPAVKMISADREGFSEDDNEALDGFAGLIKEMKQDGVTFEVCDYAIRVLGVDPASILPEVDHVGNGFISISGYQAQGYSVITID
jgi:intracellular sulfur oxidation DsrE/DsrF family protein